MRCGPVIGCGQHLHGRPIRRSTRTRYQLAGGGAATRLTVNSRGHVIKIAVDESYLDDHEFEELAEHLTRAARTATDEVGRRVAEMMVPIDERRRAFPSLSDIVEGAPDFRDLMPSGLEVESSPRPPVPGGEDGGEDSGFPTVRS